MAGMPGGLSEAKDVTPEVAEIVAAKKGDCESKSGKTFATFEPKKFVQQVVAGMIYKVKVLVDGASYIHVSIYCPLPHTGQPPEVQAVEVDKTEADAL